MKRIICGKNIILGVCGGIAAYKSVELLRLLKKQDADVHVVMTRNAGAFVGHLTFEALSEHKVLTDLFEKESDASIRHIEWAQCADAVVVAPATANLIGKFANGIADDALSTFLLAVASQVILCPSMNTHMYQNPAVQRNLKRLQDDGRIVLTPQSGQLACGTTGAGRLPEPDQILDRIISVLSPKDFLEKNILVTAGPTREAIDPVRYISNPSSGKMGYAIARAAEHRGANVTLISGPTHLPDPYHVHVVKIQSADDMCQAVFRNMENCDIIIKSAAVSDYRPVTVASQKIKKEQSEMVLHLEKTTDILKELGRKKTNQFLVGFAAETEELEKNALKKLETKNLDIIVGNLIGKPDSGFDTDTNRVTLFFRDGSKESLEVMEKESLAHELLDRIIVRIAKGNDS